MEKLKVLLIEDEEIECLEIENYMEGCEDLQLVGTTNNSTDALRLTEANCPDVVILDLELHKGGGNGFLYLLGLHQLNLPFRPYILVTTNNISDVTLESARQMGADFILAKHEASYSAQYVVEFIRMMSTNIVTLRDFAADAKGELTPQERERHIRTRIRSEMDLIGISPKAVGLPYLIDAIYLSSQRKTHNISKILSEKYMKTDTSIDRAMQNAINRAWKTNNPDDLLKYYTARIRSDRGVPTLMEFVSYYAGKINDTTE